MAHWPWRSDDEWRCGRRRRGWGGEPEKLRRRGGREVDWTGDWRRRRDGEAVRWTGVTGLESGGDAASPRRGGREGEARRRVEKRKGIGDCEAAGGETGVRDLGLGIHVFNRRKGSGLLLLG